MPPQAVAARAIAVLPPDTADGSTSEDESLDDFQKLDTSCPPLEPQRRSAWPAASILFHVPYLSSPRCLASCATTVHLFPSPKPAALASSSSQQG
jgi:hypothetical protein